MNAGRASRGRARACPARTTGPQVATALAALVGTLVVNGQVAVALAHFQLATSGDLDLATPGDFLAVTDTTCAYHGVSVAELADTWVGR